MRALYPVRIVVSCVIFCPTSVLAFVVQEAIRLRERKVASEVLAVSMGPAGCQVWADSPLESIVCFTTTQVVGCLLP